MTAKSDSKPFGFIYCVTNTISGKCYVGQTSRSIELRWRQHCVTKSQSSVLSKAIRKYGEKAFLIDELDTAESRAELNAKEVFYIKLIGARKPHIGYNIAEGGGVVFRKLSESQKAKIGAANKLVKRGPLGAEQRRKIGDAHRGVPKVVSPEAKIRMAEMLRNREYSEATRLKMSESHKGKVQPKEVVEKRAAANRGRKNTDATLALMSAIRLGKALPEDHVAGIKAAWADPVKKAARVAKIKATWAAKKAAKI